MLLNSLYGQDNLVGVNMIDLKIESTKLKVVDQR